MAPWRIRSAGISAARKRQTSLQGRMRASREPYAPEHKLPKSVPLAYIASFSTTSWPRLADSTNSGILSKFM